MSQISGRAAAARENARQADGKFGTYQLDDAGTDADLSIGAQDEEMFEEPVRMLPGVQGEIMGDAAVIEACSSARKSGTHISDDTAKSIAAQWHGGTEVQMTRLSHGKDFDPAELKDEIERLRGYSSTTVRDYMQLKQLADWADAHSAVQVSDTGAGLNPDHPAWEARWMPEEPVRPGAEDDQRQDDLIESDVQQIVDANGDLWDRVDDGDLWQYRDDPSTAPMRLRDIEAESGPCQQSEGDKVKMEKRHLRRITAGMDALARQAERAYDHEMQMAYNGTAQFIEMNGFTPAQAAEALRRNRRQAFEGNGPMSPASLRAGDATLDIIARTDTTGEITTGWATEHATEFATQSIWKADSGTAFDTDYTKADDSPFYQEDRGYASAARVISLRMLHPSAAPSELMQMQAAAAQAAQDAPRYLAPYDKAQAAVKAAREVVGNPKVTHEDLEHGARDQMRRYFETVWEQTPRDRGAQKAQAQAIAVMLNPSLSGPEVIEAGYKVQQALQKATGVSGAYDAVRVAAGAPARD